MKLLFRIFVLLIYLLSTWVLYADVQIRSSVNKDNDPVVAYNSVDDEYLVVWTEWAASGSGSGLPVMGQRMKADGTGSIGSAFTISTIGAFPSVTYNPQSNEYLVTFSLSGNIIGRRVGNSGNLIGNAVNLLSKTNSIYSKVIYNTLANNYLLVAGELIDLGNDQAEIKIFTRKIFPDGQPTGAEILVRQEGHGNYSDGARFSVAYAPITSTETTNGRFLLAIKDPSNLTMLDDNGSIVSKVYDPQQPGLIVDDHVPFQSSKVGSPYNIDIAFGNFEGEDIFMLVWGDLDKELNSLDRRGIWAGVVPAMPIEYEVSGVSTTVFPILNYGLEHSILKSDAKTWKPVIAYNKAAYKFMIAWRELPTTFSGNDTKVNHIRAASVYNSTSTPNNVVLSAISGNENPMKPAITASTKNANALVVWEDERNISTKDIDLYGNLLTTTAGKSFVLTSPNGGEIWQEGTEQQITWESAGIGVTDVRIEYSTDHGASFNLIAFETSLDGGNSYNWIVPNTPSTQCIVQITANGLSDQSDELFTIPEPELTIIEPNGGEVWYVGSTHDIWWNNYYFSDNVKIEFSTDGGVSYSTIISSTSNSGIYSWIIPDTPSSNCLVRVSDAFDGKPSDVADANFTIVAAELTLTTPNGGENWTVGTTHNITWTSQNILNNDVTIEFSIDDGSTYNFIDVHTNSQSTETYEWTVPNLPNNTTCLVRISLYIQGVEIIDVSDRHFSIYSKTGITVISPNGGEVWEVGSQQEIKWMANSFIDSVDIVYHAWAYPNTNGFSHIVTTPNDGSFIWSIPNRYEDRFWISVHDPNNANNADISDTYFTITQQPKITVTSPNGGEEWIEGEQREIKWNTEKYNGLVRIDLRTRYYTPGTLGIGGWNYHNQEIATNLPNTGSFVWRVTNYIYGFAPYQDSCKIRVADATKNKLGEPEDGKIYDSSDKTFKIFYQTNTSVGNNVKLDLNEGTKINFDKIDTAGVTYQYISDFGSPLPSGSEIFPSNSPKHYFIETTSTFSGNIELCFVYDDSSITSVEESSLQLHVFDTLASNWINITTSLDIDNNIICGEVSHLSEFAIMMPTSDDTVLFVTNTNDSGEGSFRKAIDDANSNSSADKILFNIPKTDPNYDATKGIWTIKPVTYYQSLLDSATLIDGTSQRMFIGEDTNQEGPEIVFDGSQMASANGCLSILANNIEVYELTINNFASAAVSISNANNIIISGCYIGTDYTGMKSEGNRDGITMGPDVNGTLIGPSIFLQKPNVISGNDQDGIFIVDNSKYNAVQGNYIGVNKNATDTIQNKLRGIDLSRGADNNTIMNNTVGGNYQGIYVYESSENLIRNNIIGTNETWEFDLYNSDGILVFNNSSRNTISENIIGFNRGWGIKVGGANSINNAISRNLISKNIGLGIDNYDGGNIELSPPVIVTASNTEISGTAGPNQVIEIFADSANEGQVFIDSTVSDASGNFSITLSSLPNLPNITATARDALGNTSEFSSPMIITDLDNAEDNIPIEYTLNQNYPNPFNPSTIISYQIPSSGHVSLKIYDILGNEIETLISKKQSAGKYEIVFDAKNISSGVYFYRLKTENYTITKKMIYLE